MDRGRNNVQTVWMNCDYVQVSWIKSSEASYVLISPPSVTRLSWVWWRGCCSRDRRHRGAGRPGVKHQVRATVTHTTKMDDFRVHPYKRVSQKPECVVIKYRKSVQATKYLSASAEFEHKQSKSKHQQELCECKRRVLSQNTRKSERAALKLKDQAF